MPVKAKLEQILADVQDALSMCNEDTSDSEAMEEQMEASSAGMADSGMSKSAKKEAIKKTLAKKYM
jgi:hypothetical protein